MARSRNMFDEWNDQLGLFTPITIVFRRLLRKIGFFLLR
jgi:hypothetical protein